MSIISPDLAAQSVPYFTLACQSGYFWQQDGSPRHWMMLFYLTEHYSIWFCHHIVYHSEIWVFATVETRGMITSIYQHLPPPFKTWKSYITQVKGWKFGSPRSGVSVILASWLSTNLENQEHSSQSHQYHDHQDFNVRPNCVSSSPFPMSSIIRHTIGGK